MGRLALQRTPDHPVIDAERRAIQAYEREQQLLWQAALLLAIYHPLHPTQKNETQHPPPRRTSDPPLPYVL